jgi:hypothetical protein
VNVASTTRFRLVLAFALGVSFALHAVMVVGLSTLRLLVSAPNIPIEVLPFQPKPPAPPQLDPPEPKPHSSGSPSAAKTKPKPAEPGAGKQPPPPQVEDLRGMGPSGANITLVLRGTLLAKSPHRQAVDDLLSMLPDYHTLLDGTGLHPFDDLDALLISTPDPRDVSATFLAARHRGDPRITRLDGKAIGGNDPRRILKLGETLMLLGRPEQLERIAAAQANSQTDGEGARWLHALEHFDEASKDAALQLTVADLPQLIRLQGELPLPRMIRLALSAEASPATRLLCGFDDVTTAQRFVAMWPEVRNQIRDSAPMFGGILDQLVVTRRDREVELVGRLPETQVRMLLSLAQLLGPRTPRPAAAPEPLPALDAGSPVGLDQ